MFGNFAVLESKHVKAKCLIVLSVTPGLRLAHIDDDHVVFTDNV